jgi:ribosomal-protein-alanine N-acetyltransferase
MSTIHIRAATQKDLPAIEQIEESCFHDDLRSSPRALRHSLKSPIQSVWVATAGHETIGAMVLYHHPRSIRIFSIAVLTAFRGSGAGRLMMEKALTLARRAGCAAMTLEAEQSSRALIRWYEKFGFEIKKILRDYHSSGRHAVRMRLEMKTAQQGGRVRGRS